MAGWAALRGLRREWLRQVNARGPVLAAMRRTMGMSLLLLAVLLVAACGGKSHKPSIASASGAGRGAASPTPSVDATEQMRQFAQCMRDHGVDVPDPGSDTGGGVRITESEG